MPFDFDAAVSAPFRMQPGLRRMDPGQGHLTPLAPGSRHQREKLAVLSAFAGDALCADPGFDARPALQALMAVAASEHPAVWGGQDGRAEALGLGVAVAADGSVESFAAGAFGLGDEVERCLRGLAPAWRQAGLLSLAFAEDFAVVDARSGTIPWLAVALPSGWSPRAKLGLGFAAIHAPVADNALLLNAADRLMRLVCDGDRWERFVWTVTPHPRLHAHPAHVDPAGWANPASAVPPAGAWWRTEHQTFVPLPAARQAIFTIRVDTEPLARAVAGPGRAARLHAALASMSPAVLAYRGLAPMRDALLDWLAAQP